MKAKNQGESKSAGSGKLTFADLLRFEQTLAAPFRRALDTGRLELFSPEKAARDPESPLGRALAGKRAVFERTAGQLVVPLARDSVILGLLSISGVEAEQLPPATHPFLSSMVEAALDLVGLKVANETEPVTGLANERALGRAVAAALGKLRPATPAGSKSLDRGSAPDGSITILACEPQGFDSIVDRYGVRFGETALAELARGLANLAGEATCLARAAGAFVLLLEGGRGQAREVAQRLVQGFAGQSFRPEVGDPWLPSWRLGAASVDASAVPALGFSAEGAALLKTRALRALECACRLPGSELLFHSEIMEKAGRIRDTLPLDRVAIDLGRVHGLGDGQRFHVLGQDPADGAAKAEIAVVTVGEQESVAKVVAVYDPTWNMRSGDRIRSLGPEAAAAENDCVREVEVKGRQISVVLDETTGLACHRSFGNMFVAVAAAGDPFAGAVIRLDGLEGMRQAAGRVASEAVMKSAARLLREHLGESALLGRYSPDTLVALLEGVTPEELLETITQFKQQVAEEGERTVSAGVAGHPTPGMESGEVLDNAGKALVHAGFFGVDSAVCFDAVSLNISGDAMFAAGRISQALAEYEKALLITPEEPNVLNSLGVCYGHMGQMDRALAYFERALTADPGDFMAHYNLGYAFMAKGKTAQARDQFEQALGLNEDHADTLFQLGRLAANDGRHREAVELFGRASGLPGCRPAVHRHLGEAQAAAGQTAEAEESFNKALKVNPNDWAALASLSGLYLDRGANLEIALSLARRARRLAPGNGRTLRVLARSLGENGQAAEAVELLEQALAETPEDAYLTLLLAHTEAARGKKAAARDWYVRALALEPNLDAAREGLSSLEDQQSA